MIHASARPAGDRTIPLEPASCLFCDAGTAAEVEATGYDYEYHSSDQTFTFVRCLRCGHCYLNPRPTMAAASLLYSADYYTHTSEHQTAALGVLGRVKDVVLRRRVRDLVARLPQRASVLEVGCGDGALLLSLARIRPDLRLTGLDLAFTAAEKERLQTRGIACVASPVESAQLDDETFHAVLMNQVIEHLWDVRAALARLRAALRPDGSLTLSTPNLDGYDRRLFRRSCWGGYYIPRHLNLFTPASLTLLFDQCGFRDVTIRFLTAPLVWVRSVQYALRARGIPGASLASDANLPAVAMFASLDRLALAAGLQTSNLQAIAWRR